VNDSLALELRVVELSANPAVEASWFTPEDSEGWRTEWHTGDAPNLSPPRLIHTEKMLLYGTRREDVQGRVYIQAVITTEGEVTEPILVQGGSSEEYNRQAIKAVLDWRFEPGLKDGQPVPFITLITIGS
jgi:TonB family protein